MQGRRSEAPTGGARDSERDEEDGDGEDDEGRRVVAQRAAGGGRSHWVEPPRRPRLCGRRGRWLAGWLWLLPSPTDRGCGGGASWLDAFIGAPKASAPLGASVARGALGLVTVQYNRANYFFVYVNFGNLVCVFISFTVAEVV